MVLSADYLRGHVSWSATGIWRIIDSICASDSQICDSDVSSCIEDQVLRLNVPVNDVASMHVFKAENDACNKKFYF